MTTKDRKPTYDQIIANKVKKQHPHGFEPVLPLNKHLFDWQAVIVRWAVKQGRAALFEDCGLGKTLQSLEWARQVVAKSSGRVLILCPLAVAKQTVSEGEKFGIAVKHVRESCEMEDGISVTNYERLNHVLDITDDLAGIILDESSILKSFMGKTRIELTRAFANTPYRLCGTATPAPNDYMEFGQHAEFLGVMESNEMLSRWFINDTMNFGCYRLKGHARKDFWKWVSTWAACLSMPSDIGFSNDGFILPALNIQSHCVAVDQVVGKEQGELIRSANVNATTMHREMRLTCNDRVSKCAELVNSSNESWLVWCNTNYEADALGKALSGGVVEVRGNDKEEFKIAASEWFCGRICDCQLNEFGAKLAICGKENTQPTDAQNIIPTQPAENGANHNQGPAMKTNGICVPTIEQTRADGLHGQKHTPQNGEHCNGRDTRMIQPTENGPNLPQGQLTRKADATEGCFPTTESGQPILTESLNSKAVALSVKPKKVRTKAKGQKRESADCMLTTATKAESSGVCSAQVAISDSENLQTIQTSSKKPQCICGGIKERRVMVSKPSMFGYGVNYQHCHNHAFVGLSYSFEDFYQAMRRGYRFGQKEKFNCHIIQAETEGAILQTVQRKIKQHEEMREEMKFAAESLRNETDKPLTLKTELKIERGNGWEIANGDCVRYAQILPDNSIHFSVYSPPFANLYIYSADVQDMGNCEDDEMFFEQYKFLIAEKFRITKPGCLTAVHCKNLVAYKGRDGKAGVKDFRGAIIAAHEACGWQYHSEHVIWKDPVIEMQRTKAQGLLFKQLRQDSRFSRSGMPEYLVIFRKWGEGMEDGRVEHTEGDARQWPYIGEDPPTEIDDERHREIMLWQKYASPVWMDINQTRVLNGEVARENQDEKHICPLQLDVINRALWLYTNEGDSVYSPFAGIGSEGYCAIKMRRKFQGSELKESYFKMAIGYLQRADSESLMLNL